MELSVQVIAKKIDGKVIGDKSLSINDVAEIENANSHQISFIANPKYLKHLKSTVAGAVVVGRNITSQNKTLVQVDDPYFAFMQVIRLFHPEKTPVNKGIHSTAIIDEATKIGKNPSISCNVSIGRECSIGNNVQIFPSVVIGESVKIGDNVKIYSNVTIREGTKIGSEVIIHPGVVIGSDGFGYAKKKGKYHKIPQLGIVVIENNVEVGANATIDRGTMGETRICKGSKIDNLVQIAHNVLIGENTAIAALTGISGSTRIGENVTIGGQAGFAGHIDIGDNTTIGGRSGVTKSFSENSVILGFPARPIREAKRTEAYIRKLPELVKRIKSLEKSKKKK